ncbi:MAG: trigger factor [Bacteroidetes bacterium]|nr:trigger factor [Bacteroidota bacterium]
MATIHTEHTGPLTERIDITVSQTDYLPGFEAALKQYATKANIPGFRKGMVPAGLVRKMYGASVFADEVVRTIEKALTGHLKETDAQILGQPLPSAQNDLSTLDHKAPTDYRFSFDIGRKPSFSLVHLSTASVQRCRIDVTDAMIDEEVERLRRRNGEMTEPETVGDEENVLNLRFEACDEHGEPLPDGTPHDNSLLLRYFHPDFRARLMGLKKDDSLIIRIGEAFQDKEAEWMLSDLKLDKEDPASKEKSFRITLTKIGMVEKAEMGDAFWKQVFPHMEIKSEQEFRDQIRSEIQQQFDVQTESQLHQELYHILLEKTSLELPEDFLKRWLKEGQDKPKTDEEVEAELPNFLRQLKWTLITDKIVQENAINVSREEVMAQMRREVMGYFNGMGMMQGNFEWIDGYVDRMAKDRQQFEGSYRKVQTEKVFQWAAANSNPVDAIVSLEDFQKQQEALRHES